MNLDDIFMHYEQFIRACYNNCERNAIKDADADVMRDLYGAFCDSFQNCNLEKEQIYNHNCNMVAKFLIDAIKKSSFPQNIRDGLIDDLKDASFFTIIYVLGEIDSLQTYYANQTIKK